MDMQEKTDLQMKSVPVYRHSEEYAIQHDEIEAYMESVRANIECRDAIDKTVYENYRDYCLDSRTAAAQLVQWFGLERVSYVLASTIQFKNDDGRISERNKKWAETIPVAEDKSEFGDNRNLSFLVDRTHPGLVDLLATQVRKELEREKAIPERKPSVLEKLQENSSALKKDSHAAPVKSKGVAL